MSAGQATFARRDCRVSPHARLTEDSLSPHCTVSAQVSGCAANRDSLRTHGGLTPGREGKGREGKLVVLASSFIVTSVPRETAVGR